MGSIEDAIQLQDRVNAALKCMKHTDGFENSIEESEVKGRYLGVVWMLLMCSNDISNMIRQWQGEDKPGDVEEPKAREDEGKLDQAKDNLLFGEEDGI